jgi:hypothetical protein
MIELSLATLLGGVLVATQRIPEDGLVGAIRIVKIRQVLRNPAGFLIRRRKSRDQ